MPLTSLPDEILLAIAGDLDVHALFCWMTTARYFYDRLVAILYKRDLDAEDKQLSLRAGIQGNLAALHRVALCPSTPPRLYTMAVHGDHAYETVSFLLSKGITDALTAHTTNLWPMLATVLDTALRAPRWCPVPIITSFLDHGYSLEAASPAMHAVWSMVFRLVQVHGPRPRRGTDTLRHDHCQHSTEACNVVTMRLLLQKGRARSALGGADASLLARAMQDVRRPVDLVKCLADAGADLNEPVPSASSRMCTPILAALEDALRLKSFANNPRGRSWDCHPVQVEYPKADELVQFLLSRGVEGTDEAASKRDKDKDNLTLRLLDFWDPAWRRFKRRSEHAKTRNKRSKKQRLE